MFTAFFFFHSCIEPTAESCPLLTDETGSLSIFARHKSPGHEILLWPAYCSLLMSRCLRAMSGQGMCVCVSGGGETCLPKLHQHPHYRPLLIPPRGLMKKTTTSACNNDIFHLKASFSLSSNDRLSFWLTFSGSATKASLFPAQIPTRLFPSHPWKEMK